jgi:hypothetical protein
LVGDGLAVFDEFDMVEVDDVFECVAVLFDGIVDEFDMFDGAVVVEVDDELVTVADEFDVELFIMLVFERFVFVLFAVSPPQAAPRAARPKSAESAIAFFIFKLLLSFSKINLRSAALGRIAPKLFLFLEQTK